MSTRAYVGYFDGDCAKLIYSHSDGYVEWLGKILHEHYRGLNKIKELVSMGYASKIDKHIHPPKNSGHSFDFEKRVNGVCVFYHRDRGDEFIEAIEVKGFIEEFTDAMIDYLYVFNPVKYDYEVYKYRGTHNEFLGFLTDVLENPEICTI